jgi:ribokinase
MCRSHPYANQHTVFHSHVHRDADPHTYCDPYLYLDVHADQHTHSDGHANSYVHCGNNRHADCHTYVNSDLPGLSATASQELFCVRRSEMPQVVTLGDINIDVIAHIPGYPQKGGEGLAEQGHIYCGGSAANTAIVLGRFGVDVGIIGRVGEDVLAPLALAALAEAGVDGRCIQRDPQTTTGIMLIAVTPDGERTMFGCRGANVRTDPTLLDESYITEARIFHLSGYTLLQVPQREAALRALEVAHEAGLIVTADMGLEAVMRVTDRVKVILPEVDILFPNQAEAEYLTGRRDIEGAMECLLDYGVGVVALKLGKRGCAIGSAEGMFTVPGFAVPAVDTTGAGDSFDAGIVLGSLEGWGWRESALLADALGALTATVEGAGTSLAERGEVCAFLEAYLDEPSWQDWQEELRYLVDFLS